MFSHIQSLQNLKPSKQMKLKITDIKLHKLKSYNIIQIKL